MKQKKPAKFQGWLRSADWGPEGRRFVKHKTRRKDRRHLKQLTKAGQFN